MGSSSYSRGVSTPRRLQGIPTNPHPQSTRPIRGHLYAVADFEPVELVSNEAYAQQAWNAALTDPQLIVGDLEAAIAELGIRSTLTVFGFGPMGGISAQLREAADGPEFRVPSASRFTSVLRSFDLLQGPSVPVRVAAMQKEDSNKAEFRVEESTFGWSTAHPEVTRVRRLGWEPARAELSRQQRQDALLRGLSPRDMHRGDVFNWEVEVVISAVLSCRYEVGVTGQEFADMLNLQYVTSTIGI
jgi:hypothetical protein